MAQGDDHNLIFNLRHFIENQVRVRRRRDEPQSWIVRERPRKRMLRKQGNNLLDPNLHLARPLRRTYGNVVEQFSQFAGSSGGIANPHRPCFAQMARTCSSVANSRRAASPRDLANEAFSSAVNIIPG